MTYQEFKIAGVSCQHCVGKVKKALESIDSVKNVTVVQEEQIVKIEADPMPSIDAMNVVLEGNGHYKLLN
jgi:copper chaperone CopZ